MLNALEAMSVNQRIVSQAQPSLNDSSYIRLSKSSLPQMVSENKEK